MAREPLPPEVTQHLRLLGVKEVAAILGVNWYKVKELIDRGELHTVRFGLDGDHYIPLKSVEHWQERVARGESGYVGKRRGRPRKALGTVA